ncbi:hypothetical protein F8388_010121 [Cannabis sativa]|uniref:Uncharacterized protein n=1 Tax=Cannabis sativa TaxID=3483 RepID=A0A7J6GRK9_CANSA|nr:hypothetical protein F8388_010121 [Cannabis sativa]
MANVKIMKCARIQIEIQLSFSIQTIVPRLKHSLSLTLKHFLPLSGNLIWPESSYKPLILYNEGNEDVVSFTVAETDADFHRLSGTNEFLEATEYHPLIPNLAVSRERAAILAFQVTLFPNFGFSIGTAKHHAAIDGKSVHMFLKTWTHICQSQQQQQEYNYSYSPLELKPFFDRTVIVDSKGIDAIIAEQLQELDGGPHNRSLIPWKIEVLTGAVRGSFQLTRENINKLRQLLKESLQMHMQKIWLGKMVFFVAVKAISDAIRSLETAKETILYGLENLAPMTLKSLVEGKGSHDESYSIAGAISLSDTRNGDGIEVGLVLKKHDMESFAFLFHQGLE